MPKIGIPLGQHSNVLDKAFHADSLPLWLIIGDP
jgi:hypothetical protein